MTLVFSLVAACLLSGGGSFFASADDAPAARPSAWADPWAIVRGCTAVLDKAMACRSDKHFKKITARWIAAAEGQRAGAGKMVEARIRGWARRDARRQQCAAWANRGRVAEHLGPDSKLAKLASEPATTCERFAQELDSDGWIRTAITKAE